MDPERTAFDRALALPRSFALGAKRALGTLAAFDPRGPLELGILGKVILHAIAVGVAAGFIGSAFVAGVEVFQGALLERLIGLEIIRARGDMAPIFSRAAEFRPWLILIVPILGGLACGAITAYAPETRGGGAGNAIAAFHAGGVVRSRVIWVKALASMVTLGSCGGGGRAGPTMQIGAAIGSTVARLLGVTARERRILLLAGLAAGISAVFRTPLGAAILAVEVVYRDGFESEALIPALLASVVSYSIVTSIFGQSPLIARAPGYPFVPLHLPLYALLGLLCAWIGSAYIAAFAHVRRIAERLPIPEWTRPAAGGAITGLIVFAMITAVGPAAGTPRGQGLGLVSSGFGGVEAAVVGVDFLEHGWMSVGFLLALCATKLLTAASTIGTGGSAGDFLPSVAVGALLGRAFGLAASIATGDVQIDPGAFAFVGMGAVYGSVAHVPLASLVMVSELAGSYDLLVPLMVTEAVAFVALRKRSLYPAQAATVRDSPVHQRQFTFGLLDKLLVEQAMSRVAKVVSFAPNTRAEEMLRLAGEADPNQDVFPVLDASGAIKGLIPSESLIELSVEKELRWAIAADLMQAPVTVRATDSLFVAQRTLLEHELRELPVVGEANAIIGFLDHADIARMYVEKPAEDTAPPAREE